MCDAPKEWAGIDASVWQGVKGRWAAPQHYMCNHMAMFPELPHYFIERFTKEGDAVLDPFVGGVRLLLRRRRKVDSESETILIPWQSL